MEAHLEGEEPTSVDMEPEAAQWRVPREDAAMMLVRGPRKHRRDWNLAAGLAARNWRRWCRKSVDPRRDWPSATEGRPAMWKWHDTRNTSSGETGPVTSY
jgi:hypothetical protein